MTAGTKRPSAAVRLRPRGSSHRPVALVGRDGDVARVLDLLSDVSRGSRLVTILGPPGMGKTRVAEKCLELAAEIHAADGGAWFCDLTNVSDASGLSYAVTSILHGGVLSDTSGELVDHFNARGPMLLVLDNFEQLVTAAGVVHGWCEAAPELTVLITSRERLGVEGEIVVELGPLDCPSAAATDEEVLASDAVRLFVLRARAAGCDVGQDARVLGDLVRQLDGIPLAIELAAARMRILSPTELAARLSRRPELLARRQLHPRDRHATLASAIEWSWQLLSVAEQRALAECSVFAGDFAIDAAEALLGEHAVELVGALCDKSLVHMTSDGRLGLYLSIAQFAAARLVEYGAAVVAAARLRHARFFAVGARGFSESRTLQHGPDAMLRARLWRDRAHLCAALAFVRETDGPPELAAELALGLTLVEGAPVELCLDALGAALGALEDADAPDVELVARLLMSRQSCLGYAGRFEESRVDMARLLGLNLSPSLRTLALVMQGIQLRYQGRTREALQSHLEAAKCIDADTPIRLRAMQHACMGRLGHELGDELAARQQNERARLLAAQIGDAWIEALPVANIALLEQELGRFDEATRLLDQALAALERVEEPSYVAAYSLAAGDLHFEQERPDEARKAYERAARSFGGWASYRDAIELHCSLAALEARYGSIDEAEMHLERARGHTPRSGSPLFDVLLEVSGAHLQLRRARDDSQRAVVYVRVRTRHAELRLGEVAATSFSARFALRLLGQMLDANEVASSESPTVGPIILARDGSAFERDGRRVDLGRRGSLRRILAALVAAGTVGATRDTLVAEGWPGERMLFDAGRKRLKVAVATLRALGLREAIVTREEGYALDPRVVREIQPPA